MSSAFLNTIADLFSKDKQSSTSLVLSLNGDVGVAQFATGGHRREITFGFDDAEGNGARIALLHLLGIPETPANVQHGFSSTWRHVERAWEAGTAITLSNQKGQRIYLDDAAYGNDSRSLEAAYDAAVQTLPQTTINSAVESYLSKENNRIVVRRVDNNTVEAFAVKITGNSTAVRDERHERGVATKPGLAIASCSHERTRVPGTKAAEWLTNGVWLELAGYRDGVRGTFHGPRSAPTGGLELTVRAPTVEAVFERIEHHGNNNSYALGAHYTALVASHNDTNSVLAPATTSPLMNIRAYEEKQ